MLNIPFRAVATTAQLESAETIGSAPVTVLPVPDGPNFSIGATTVVEDTPTTLGLVVTPTDQDGSSPETVDFMAGPNGVRVTVSGGATLSGGMLISPGVYEFASSAALAAAQLTPPANYHGDIIVTVSAGRRMWMRATALLAAAASPSQSRRCPTHPICRGQAPSAARA